MIVHSNEYYAAFRRARNTSSTTQSGTAEKVIMMIAVDHIAIPARDVVASARFLSEILGIASAEPRGPEREMRWLAIGESAALLLTPADTVASQHVAFRVDEGAFAGIVDRLRAKGIAFGNHPEAPTNAQTADPFGGRGRVYFADPNGHFFEVIA
jgi:catechol 2,3-dioxygenase-like lactoylglutathione lyase family enzyme